jgi:hypothetical protein
LAFPDQGDDAIEIHDRDGYTFGMNRDSGIARRGDDFRHQRALRQFPDDRVFPTAATYHHDLHARFNSCLSRLTSLVAMIRSLPDAKWGWDPYTLGATSCLSHRAPGRIQGSSRFTAHQDH